MHPEIKAAQAAVEAAKSNADRVDAIMSTIPPKWQDRWCGGENDPCACMGCVPIANRLIMMGLAANQIDAERIDESVIPSEVYQKYKVTKAEWAEWMMRQPK